MADQNQSPTDEAGSVIVVESSSLVAETKQSPRSFLASARRNLNEDELAAPAVRSFMLSELEELEDQCRALKTIEAKYHDLRVEKAVLDARLKTNKWHEILSGLCLAIGAAGIGIGFRLLSIDSVRDIGIGTLVVCAVLIIAGIASKVWK